MCVDFTNLNVACPKDSCPLQSVDNLVDKSSRCELLSSMVAYSSYNQIKITREYEENTTFV